MSIPSSYYDIDDVLYEFAYENTLREGSISDLAECALNFYKMLNYPIEYIDKELFNLAPDKFFPYDYDTILAKSDGKYLDYIYNISELFYLGETNQQPFCEEHYEDDNFEVRLITFLAVELEPIFIDKYGTRRITKLISDSYGRPVFILFRHGKRICFGVPLKRKNKFDTSVDITQTQFASDWIKCYNPKTTDLEMCMNLCFDELECKNIGEFYFSLFDALGYRIDRYALKVEKNLDDRLKYKKTKLDYEFDEYLQSVAYKYDSFLSIDDIKEEFVYKMFGSGVSLSKANYNSKNNRSRYFDKLEYYHEDDELSYTHDTLAEYKNEDGYTDSIDIAEYDEVREIGSEHHNYKVDVSGDETLEEIRLSEIESDVPDEEEFALYDRGLNISIENTSNWQTEMQTERRSLSMGSGDMEKELISMIVKGICGLEQNVNKLGNWYREKSQNIPLDLPLAKRRLYANDLFDKEELVNSNASDVETLKQKIEIMIKQIAPELVNMQEDKGIVTPDDTSIHLIGEPCEDIGRLNSYSFTIPYKIKLFGQSINVDNWTDVLIKVCESMISLKPTIIRDFDKSEVLKGRSRKYFSANSSQLSPHAKRLSTGLFVETNFCANDIVEFCDEVLTQCGFSQNEIEYYYHQRTKQKSEPVCNSVEGNDIEKDDDIIYFPQKYNSINITYNLMKSILDQIFSLGLKQTPYIDNGELVDTMSDMIKSESHYEQPHHVIRSVRMFLMDLGVIALFEGAKRGKYVLKEPDSLREMMKDKKIIIELLKDIH